MIWIKLWRLLEITVVDLFEKWNRNNLYLE